MGRSVGRFRLKKSLHCARLRAAEGRSVGLLRLKFSSRCARPGGRSVGSNDKYRVPIAFSAPDDPNPFLFMCRFFNLSILRCKKRAYMYDMEYCSCEKVRLEDVNRSYQMGYNRPQTLVRQLARPVPAPLRSTLCSHARPKWIGRSAWSAPQNLRRALCGGSVGRVVPTLDFSRRATRGGSVGRTRPTQNGLKPEPLGWSVGDANIRIYFAPPQSRPCGAVRIDKHKPCDAFSYIIR